MDRLDDLKFWAASAFPTEAITDGYLKELLQWAIEEIETLRAIQKIGT